MRFLCRHDIHRKASSGPLAYIGEGKHVKKSSISSITDTTDNGFIDADMERAGIRDCNFAEFLVNHNTTAPIVISMD